MKDSELPPLTDEEAEAALLEGRRKKFFRLRNEQYWIGEHKKAEQRHEDEKANNRIKSKIKKTVTV